jgi:hypothetical protein
MDRFNMHWSILCRRAQSASSANERKFSKKAEQVIVGLDEEDKESERALEYTWQKLGDLEKVGDEQHDLLLNERIKGFK